MRGRYVAIGSLCCGGYLLGVATSLLLLQLNDDLDRWRQLAALAVGVLAIAILSIGLVLLQQRDNALHADRSRVTGISTGWERSAARAIQSTPNRRAREDSLGSTTVPLPEEAGQYAGTGEDGQAGAAVQRARGSREPVRTSLEPRVDEALAPERDAPNGAPPSVSEPQAADLIRVWDHYRRTGDGHFSLQGLQKQLDDQCLDATVLESNRVGGGDSVLAVETPSRKPVCYVLPSFAKSPRAVTNWFHDRSGGALTGRIERVLEVAEGRLTETGQCDPIRKGVVA